MKNKLVLTLSCLFSLLFLTYIFKLTDEFSKIETNLIASPNIVDVTESISSRLLVQETPLEDGQWTTVEFEDANWNKVQLPTHANLKDPLFKEGSYAYYRIQLPKSSLQELTHARNEVYLALQYIMFSRSDIYINGEFYRSLTPTNYLESLTNLPLDEKKDNLIAIKGWIKSGDVGIQHRGKILAGKGGELNELHRKSYKNVTVFNLIFIFCKGSILFVFTLIFLVMKVEKFFEKFLLFAIFVISEDLLSGELAAFLNFNQQVLLYNAINIGIISFLFLFLSEVLNKRPTQKLMLQLTLTLSLVSFVVAIDALYTNKLFNIDIFLKFWRYAHMGILIYFIPQVFKVDRVVCSIMLISLGLSAWSVMHVNQNLKAMANLLLFFMVAYQTFVLFRREQNLLQEKQKQLLEQEKDVAIGKTAALLAHDVRRPLEQMNLILNRIASGESGEEFLRAAKRDVDFSLISVTNQITDIMNFSRSKSFTLAPISFYRVLSGSIKQILTITKNMDLKVEYDFQNLNLVLGDESRLASVLTNLISNAVEAIRDIGQKNQGMLRFSTSMQEGRFIFKIFNDGPHIPDEILPEIFKPLFTHGKNLGTGLGLASVAKIVREHEGEIQVENREGGVEFSVVLKATTLPDSLDSNDFKAHSSEYSYSTPVKQEKTATKPLRIFLMDDDPQVYEYFQFLVTHLEYDVELEFCTDFSKGEELVKAKRYDLYILDYDLGNPQSGLDFYHKNLNYLGSEVVIHSNRDKAIIHQEKCSHQQKPMSPEALNVLCAEVYNGRLKILLVDDSELTLMAWEMYHGKHNIKTVASPQEALEFISQAKESSHVCVVDYYFDNSDMNGEGLALKLKEIRSDLKIILSSNSQIEIEGLPSISKNDFEIRRLIKVP